MPQRIPCPKYTSACDLKYYDFTISEAIIQDLMVQFTKGQLGW